MKFEGQQVAVAVSASDAEGRAGSLHTRPDYVSGIDGVAQGDIRIAFRADVAYRSEARQQSEPRILGPDQRCARRRDAQGFVPTTARVGGEVSVDIDEAGQECSVSQIDERSAGDGR